MTNKRTTTHDDAREAALIEPLKLLCDACDHYFTDWHESRCQQCGVRYVPNEKRQDCPECGSADYDEMCPKCTDGILAYAEEDARFVHGFTAGFDAGAEFGRRAAWVPVSERLPDATDEQVVYWVTVYADGSDFRNGNRPGLYVEPTCYGLVGEEPSWGSEEHAGYTVIAWMPYNEPDPYTPPQTAEEETK